jgi:16S rRNA (guanine(1405)-N(7))-methyltransferase
MEAIVDQLVGEILNQPKYRNLGLCEETIRDIVSQELRHHKKRNQAIASAKKKIHNVVAVYLGGIDIQEAMILIDNANTSQEESNLKDACIQIMQTHVSTQERISLLDQLYPTIFGITGVPSSILDLACGLHPFSFPWMGLSVESISYHAYDIYHPRVMIINHFFLSLGLPALAETRDILLHPPNQEADVAFIFKEIHRFEQRRQGSTLGLLDFLRVKYVVISLPTRSIHSTNDFTTSYRTMLFKIIADRNWSVAELLFKNEMFFCLKKK